MGELAIVIPAPIADDPENVVTALETAALFGERGDASEALRWVRHAATSSGESGRDARALDLARAAANFTPSPPEVAARPRSLPVPPARPNSVAPDANHAGAASARPAPPSSSRAPRPWPAVAARVPLAPRVAALPKEAASAKARRESPVGVRSAARVSVTPGESAGVYVVRVLADSAVLPTESLEAFLVLADPQAELASGRS